MGRKKQRLLTLEHDQKGQQVYAGVYRFYETHGLPLDVILFAMKERGLMPSWTSFYEQARAAGMSHDRVLAKLDEALSDVYGSGFRDVVVKTLDERYGSLLERMR